MARPEPAKHPTRPTGTGRAVLICNGPSAEGFSAADEDYSACLNAGFLSHTKVSGRPVDAAYTVDCPFSIQPQWTAFTGFHVQAEHVLNLRALDEADNCSEVNRHYSSSAFCALDWLRKHKYQTVLIVGMDALYGGGHEGLSQRTHVQGCLAFAKLFPGGLYVRDLEGQEHKVTDAYLASIPAGLTVQKHGVSPSGEALAAPPLFVGYYTVDTPYEDEAKGLRLSMEAHGLDYYLESVKNLGSWQKNTQYKARYIQAMLAKHKRPLVYVDVDAIVVQRPSVLLSMPATVDLAAVHYAVSGKELLSGTVYFGNTPACRALVDRWVEINAKYPDVLPDGRDAWDQRTLDMAMSAVTVRFQELPQEYTVISGLTQQVLPDIQPVILHTRGAYRFKAQINAGGAPTVYREPRPWVVWPSATPAVAAKQAVKWRDLDYHVAILVEGDAEVPGAVDLVLRQEKWGGFPKAANALCRAALEHGAKVVVVAGDDIDPDPQTPGPEIAARFNEHFKGSYGVMQPTGDNFGAFDTCCISPWIGKEFIQRAYRGAGPYHEGYTHCFCDKELQGVAKLMGRFWQAPNLCQRHNHWTRGAGSPAPYQLVIRESLPADRALYETRLAGNFPGYRP